MLAGRHRRAAAAVARRRVRQSGGPPPPLPHTYSAISCKTSSDGLHKSLTDSVVTANDDSNRSCRSRECIAMQPTAGPAAASSSCCLLVGKHVVQQSSYDLDAQAVAEERVPAHTKERVRNKLDNGGGRWTAITKMSDPVYSHLSIQLQL